MSNPKSENQNPATTTLSTSQFSHTLTTTAIAQILRSLGFKSAKPSALRTITRITTLFLQSLASTAVAHASFSCGRTHCNLFDIIYAIEYHSLPFGFSGASSINQPLLSSKILQDISYFIDELPFGGRAKLYGSSSSSSVIFSGKFDASLKKEDDRRGPEVPKWLPLFPDVKEDDNGGVKRKDNEECLWEEKEVTRGVPRIEKSIKGGREVAKLGRRERVKFKLGQIRTTVKGGGLDALELRNRVCRGGKRVCLIKRVGDTTRFFQDDDDNKNYCSCGL